MQLFDRTLGQWLEHWAEETPDKEYIVYSDRNLRFTWSQLNRRVDDIAICLREDWCGICYSEYELQAIGVGVSLPELGYAYTLYCEW